MLDYLEEFAMAERLEKAISEVIAERKKGLPGCGLVAHIPDFEGFYFGDDLSADKPYHAIVMLNSPDFQKSEK